MKQKKKQIAKEKKLFSNKKLAIILVVLLAIIVLGFLFVQIFLQAPEVKFSFNAAIVDQLGEEFPNPYYNETGVVSNILKGAGFNVSYHEGNTIDVAFYKGLARYNYGIIILRAHFATREGETIVDLFSSEEFSMYRYVSERENGLLTEGYYSWKPGKSYFAITPKFIENLEGGFPKSIVIAMGCNSLNETCKEMAEAFIKKGAKAYIGWTGSVDPSHTDNETAKLLGKFLAENKTISEAVDAVKPDPFYGSRMEYYPPAACNLTISDLITEAKASVTSQITLNHFEKGFPLIYVINSLCSRFKKGFRFDFSLNGLPNFYNVLKPLTKVDYGAHRQLG
jgi:hypothetical protein